MTKGIYQIIGAHPSSVRQACSGKLKTHLGLYWNYWGE